ncbi:MAG: hypothetical protein F6K35_06805 [Okeania sp. SIO2H7]|nr:hypothetical protein [Okeania sp. SIO2H7]
MEDPQNVEQIFSFSELVNLGGTGIVLTVLMSLLDRLEKRIMDRINEIFMAFNNGSGKQDENLKEIVYQLKQLAREQKQHRCSYFSHNSPDDND